MPNDNERVLGPGASGDPEDPGDPSTPIEPPKPAAELKGQELDQALEEADLPKSGSADEKRHRLAEQQGGAQPRNDEEAY